MENVSIYKLIPSGGRENYDYTLYDINETEPIVKNSVKWNNYVIDEIIIKDQMNNYITQNEMNNYSENYEINIFVTDEYNTFILLEKDGSIKYNKMTTVNKKLSEAEPYIEHENKLYILNDGTKQQTTNEIKPIEIYFQTNVENIYIGVFKLIIKKSDRKNKIYSFYQQAKINITLFSKEWKYAYAYQDGFVIYEYNNKLIRLDEISISEVDNFNTIKKISFLSLKYESGKYILDEFDVIKENISAEPYIVYNDQEYIVKKNNIQQSEKDLLVEYNVSTIEEFFKQHVKIAIPIFGSLLDKKLDKIEVIEDKDYYLVNELPKGFYKLNDKTATTINLGNVLENELPNEIIGTNITDKYIKIDKVESILNKKRDTLKKISTNINTILNKLSNIEEMDLNKIFNRVKEIDKKIDKIIS